MLALLSAVTKRFKWQYLKLNAKFVKLNSMGPQGQGFAALSASKKTGGIISEEFKQFFSS